MKQLFLFISCIIFTISGAAQKTGSIEHHRINSAVFDTVRSLSVFLPDEYIQEPQRKFEVLYVFDAQKDEVFNLAVSIADYLTENDANPMIIVGIKTQKRWSEFLPEVKDEKAIAQIKEVFGNGFEFGNAEVLIQHLHNEVFPYIHNKYRTLPVNIGIGHSFGATFLTYATIKYPMLFDASINISPNYVFDNERMVEHIKGFKNNEAPLHAYNFIAYGHAGDYENNFYEATQKAIGLFTKYKGDGILFSSREFPEANHSSILPYGITAGLTDYYNTVFLNGVNAVTYYKELESKSELNLNAGQISRLAYNCFWNNKPDDAITIINWGIEKLPHDYNIYDSMAEFQAAKGNIDEARKYYDKAIAILKSQKKITDSKTYKEKLAYYTGNLEKLNKK